MPLERRVGKSPSRTPPEAETTVSTQGLPFALPLVGIAGDDPRRAGVTARVAELPGEEAKRTSFVKSSAG